MKDTLGFSPGKKVLSAQDMDRVQEATNFLVESRRLLGQAQEQIASAQASAREEGFSVGYRDGRKAALEDMLQIVEQVRTQLLSSEADLSEIVISAVQKMIGDVDSTETARKALRRALQDAADAVWIKVRSSPEDQPALLADLENPGADALSPALRSIEPDPLLKPGELVIETPKGRVHVGVRQQMARLQTGLSRMHHQNQG